MIELALFDTPIGRCGIAWEGDRIEGTQLPEQRDADTRRRLHDRFDGPSGEAVEGTPPPVIGDAIERMVASLRGEADDLVDVPLDLDALPPFRRKVFEVVRTIPAGETLSYGDVALAVGSPGAARAVGQALGRNPFPIVIPCHRVLAAGGRIGGFTAQGGVSVKEKMLAAEGVFPHSDRRPQVASLRQVCAVRATQPRADAQSVRPAAARNAATMVESSSSAADGSSGSRKPPRRSVSPVAASAGTCSIVRSRSSEPSSAFTTGKRAGDLQVGRVAAGLGQALLHLRDARAQVAGHRAPRDPARAEGRERAARRAG